MNTRGGTRRRDLVCFDKCCLGSLIAFDWMTRLKETWIVWGCYLQVFETNGGTWELRVLRLLCVCYLPDHCVNMHVAVLQRSKMAAGGMCAIC